ncbi:MAG TPA: amidohydrolase family protein [Casimicrobiaceae bacterium]|nr:amidohydrolase family protein [Casimicrobiaceae bacterium]
MQVDAHHHVWSLARGDYGWLTPNLEPIYRDFSLADHMPLARWANVDASVLVQAAPTLAETHYLLDVAKHSANFVRAIVGWVDLASADAVPQLARLRREPLLKAIRPMLQDHPEDWLLQPSVQAALEAFPRLGLRLEALVRPEHLPALLKTLERRPDLTVIVDHGAKPDIAGAAWQPWADRMRAVAAHPRVRCKLSGLATEAGPSWTIDTLRPYVAHLIDCFGAERLMWGSDWPVVELGGGYKRWRAATIALLKELDDAARAGVLGENARRCYGF